MQQRMKAEIIFLDPNDVRSCSAALIEEGFEVEVLDWIDDDGPAVWIIARKTVIDHDGFFDWVTRFTEPLGGDVCEAGFEDPNFGLAEGSIPHHQTLTAVSGLPRGS